VWQIRFILNQVNSKKTLNQASNEIESVSSLLFHSLQLAFRFGKDFDRYLLREIIDQIDLKDPVKAQKDKNEPLKVTLLGQELARCSQKPDYLTYFGDVSFDIFES
jgi:hypothetical protein